MTGLTLRQMMPASVPVEYLGKRLKTYTFWLGGHLRPDRVEWLTPCEMLAWERWWARAGRVGRHSFWDRGWEARYTMREALVRLDTPDIILEHPHQSQQHAVGARLIREAMGRAHLGELDFNVEPWRQVWNLAHDMSVGRRAVLSGEWARVHRAAVRANLGAMAFR